MLKQLKAAIRQGLDGVEYIVSKSDYEQVERQLIAAIMPIFGEAREVREPRCECGHLKSEHMSGKHYCIKGCYTTQEQADFCREEFGERTVCTQFTEAK